MKILQKGNESLQEKADQAMELRRKLTKFEKYIIVFVMYVFHEIPTRLAPISSLVHLYHIYLQRRLAPISNIFL